MLRGMSFQGLRSLEPQSPVKECHWVSVNVRRGNVRTFAREVPTIHLVRGHQVGVVVNEVVDSVLSGKHNNLSYRRGRSFSTLYVNR